VLSPRVGVVYSVVLEFLDGWSGAPVRYGQVSGEANVVEKRGAGVLVRLKREHYLTRNVSHVCDSVTGRNCTSCVFLGCARILR
jgi:hypothetical protein